LYPSRKIDIFLVESDSDDKTINKLEELKSLISGFQYVSLGNLRDSIPDRVDRIRCARNAYVRYIRSNQESNKWKIVVVADLDGINRAIKIGGIASSVRLLDEYAGVFANQRFGYYDLSALRHPYWNPQDPFPELYFKIRELALMNRKSIFSKWVTPIKTFRLRTNLIYKKMLIIHKGSKIIEVDSAFGGMGIYKPEVFLNFNYDKISSNTNQCEHVDLHLKAISEGYKFVINPNFINSNLNMHNIFKFWPLRILRKSTLLINIFRRLIAPNRL
jgi:hypothetical protein